MPSEKTYSTGKKLSLLRKKKGLSLEDLSAKTGLSVRHLRQIEEGAVMAPVGDILNISRILTFDPATLLKPPSDKKPDRAEAAKLRESSYGYTLLTQGSGDKHLRAFRVVIPPHSEHPKVNYVHEGEEFVYVLKGEVEIRVGHKTHLLRKDDSLHFNSGHKHTLKNPGNKETLLIVTVFTP